MSESMAKPRTMIDLDEFERRLRRPSAASPTAGGDALAELARLVGGQQDPFESVFAPHEHAPARREPQIPQYEAPHYEAPQYDDQWDLPPPAVTPQPPSGLRGRPLAGDFAAIEAGLRGSLPPESVDFSASQAPHAHYPENLPPPPPFAAADHNVEADWGEQAPPLPHFAAVAEAAARSRRPLYITAAIIVIGLGGIGATFALKGPTGVGREVAVIKAVDGPTKVQANNTATDAPGQNGSLLDKGPQPAPTAIVNRTEQPVDLSRSSAPPSDRPMRVVTLGSTQIASNAATVPVPPSPGQTDTAPILPPFGTMDMIEPKRVKTISVRPDGTPLPSDATASTPQDTQPTARAPQNVTAPKAATPKTLPHSVTSSKTPTAQDSVKTADDANKTQDTAAARPQTPKPVKVATAETTDATSDSQSARGSFAVQLAAPATEEEARQSATRLGRQFGGALAGHHLTYHHATVGDKSVYRVRVGGLSHDEATALCEKLKSSGGSCFVAKN